MPLAPPVIYAEIAAARAAGGFPFSGFKFDQLALGTATAIAAWAVGQPQNVFLQGVSSGAVGGGAVIPVTSKIIVPPNIPIMMAGFTGAGFNGPLGRSLAVVMALGIGNAFSKSAQYVGPVAGVGVGADVAKITVANAATLVPLLLASCSGALGGSGPMLAMYAVGLATGTAGMLLTGIGFGAVAGVPGPAPSVGSSQCVVV